MRIEIKKNEEEEEGEEEGNKYRQGMIDRIWF